MSDTLQIEQPTISFLYINFGNDNGQMRTGQSFTTVGAFNCNRIDILGLCKVGSPVDGINVALYTDVSSKPDTLIATSATTVSGSSLTTTPSPFSFVFSEPVSLSATTKYWIVVTRTNETIDVAAYYRTSGANSNPYAGGGRSSWWQSTTSWGVESATYDIGFAIYSPASSVFVRRRQIGQRLFEPTRF